MNTEKIRDFVNDEALKELKEACSYLNSEESRLLLSSVEQLEKEWGDPLPGRDDGEKTLDLRREYAYLFLTPQGVHPFESVYRGKKKMLMDKPWEKVRAFYRSLGLEKDSNEMHPEDHAAVELGFMAAFAYLSSGEIPEHEEAVFGEDDMYFTVQVQQHFLERHLLKWVPMLCDDIVRKSRHPFYRWAAQFTNLYLQVDQFVLEKNTMMRGEV